MSVRAFASGPRTLGEELELDREESHYIVRVRRRRTGDAIELLDPAGGGHAAVVVEANPKRSRVRIEARLPERAPLNIDVAAGAIDSKAAYEAVSRACEAGARSLTWVQTEHSVRAPLNEERVARVLQAAQRQCGRLDRMPVHGPVPLTNWLQRVETGFIASTRVPTDPGSHHAPDRALTKPLGLLIGPEGGLTPREELQAGEAGLTPIGLGPFVLRTEIAIVAAVARIGAIAHT